MTKFNFLDCTLRDGGYHNNWDFSKELIQNYINNLSKTSIQYIELGFRNFEQGFPLGLTGYTNDRLINNLSIPKNLKIGVMINAGEFKKNKMTPLKNLKRLFPSINKKIHFVRFACHFDEVYYLSDCIKWLNKNKISVFINLMQISEIKELQIKTICNYLNKRKIKAIYLADSLGVLKPKSLLNLKKKFDKYSKKELGLHAHNNLNLALDNSNLAIKNNFKWIDCTITGMGRGPGNLKTEDILKFYVKKDLTHIIKLKKKYFSNLQKIYKWGPNKYYRFAAKYKIHPTYIQEMLSDKRYNKKNYNLILKSLKDTDSRKYHLHKLFLPNNIFVKKPKSHWNPEINLNNKNILIIGPSESVKKNRLKIETFIKKNKIFVIGVNTADGISENLINLRSVCHPKRIIADALFHNNSKTTLVMPSSTLPTQLNKTIGTENKFILDYGLQLNGKKKISIFKNYCSIPKPLIILYTLSIALSGKANRIFLAGFDGFKNDDPASDETSYYINRITSKFKKVFLKTITKSKLNLNYYKI